MTQIPEQTPRQRAKEAIEHFLAYGYDPQMDSPDVASDRLVGDLSERGLLEDTDAEGDFLSQGIQDVAQDAADGRHLSFFPKDDYTVRDMPTKTFAVVEDAGWVSIGSTEVPMDGSVDTKDLRDQADVYVALADYLDKKKTARPDGAAVGSTDYKVEISRRGRWNVYELVSPSLDAISREEAERMVREAGATGDLLFMAPCTFLAVPEKQS